MSFDAFWEIRNRSLPVEEPEALARAVWDHCHSVLTPTEEGLQAELHLANIDRRGLQAILCREMDARSETREALEKAWQQLDDQDRQIAELTRERDEALRDLGNAQQWIDSDPDWKARFMERYRAQGVEKSEAVTQGILLSVSLHDLQSQVDLWRDEFLRIKACGSASECVISFCDRALSEIKQRVPLIEQRDKLESENHRLTAERDRLRTALEHVQGCLAQDMACCCLKGDELIQSALSTDDGNYSETPNSSNSPEIPDSSLTLKAENERLKEQVEQLRSESTEHQRVCHRKCQQRSDKLAHENEKLTAGRDRLRTALEASKNNFTRGYFCAVAKLIETDGLITSARELFGAGGDPSVADSCDYHTFQSHGLVAALAPTEPTPEQPAAATEGGAADSNLATNDKSE